MLHWRNLLLSSTLLAITAMLVIGGIKLGERESRLAAQETSSARSLVAVAATTATMRQRATTPIEVKKEAFLRRMLPAIMAENARILRDRERLEQLAAFVGRGGTPSPADQAWLNELAREYETEPDDFDTLLRRVDVIPPSLALAQSAEETGWGQSRFAEEANAYFGQHTWTPRNGVAPRGSGPRPAYYIRKFNSLSESVHVYMNNLNSHRAYRKMREKRAEMRARGETINGQELAAGLLRYSERGEGYVRSVRAIIKANALTRFDRVDVARTGLVAATMAAY